MGFEYLNWTCEYCGQPTTITEPHIDSGQQSLGIADTTDYDVLYFSWKSISCPNQDCKKITFNLNIFSHKYLNEDRVRVRGKVSKFDKTIKNIQILPESSAKPQPKYIPEPILKDYIESCRIRDLSPKASATLSRRCLQGIIRNFHSIKKKTLKEEIDELKNKFDPMTWEAIDAVRKIGNIGAHMEKDINLIVDVDPDEAQLLIELIEILFKEWYVAKHDREQSMQGLIGLAKKRSR